MNTIKLEGYFGTVHAYTDGAVRITNVQIWQKHLGKDEDETQFVFEDSANGVSWIKVTMDSVLKDYCEDKGLLEVGKRLRIEGELKTEVHRGTGIVSNYIFVRKIKAK